MELELMPSDASSGSQGGGNAQGAQTAPTVDREVDARGLSCPLPILRTKKMLADMTSGQIVRVLATDAGAPDDFEAFARQTGNAMLASRTLDDGVFEFLLRRK